ncbi:MAG: DegT/DnrJ/EryC1/StrS family aminotransferase [Candidatus Scalindua sp.]|nr:DegT/DnrJ/EryC1/StrS family aminotransferase [Candidatus Scalindua sp.]
MKNIPFIDLINPHLELEEEFLTVFKKALRTAGFIGGPMVESFENDFAAFCNTKYCVGLNSGTDALRFGLMAAGIKEGDIVITVPNTFIATTEAISQAGALPVFVDVDERTYNMNPALLREYIETRCRVDHKTQQLINTSTGKPVKAVVPVHLYGQVAEMDTIMEIANKYKLVVVEDACQAHGARYQSKRTGDWEVAGSMGLVSAFSFYPGKNLGALGDGGAITTNDKEIARTIRLLRDHGQTRKYYHEREGYNGRLDAIQAGILQVKLRRLSSWNENRYQNANRYNEILCGVKGLKTPYEPEWSKAVYHLYIIRTKNRDKLQAYLSENDIDTGLHYPIPLHLQKAYVHLGFKEGDFPVSEAAASEILSLPMYPQLTHDQQIRVCEKIKEFVSRERNQA